VVTGVGLTCRPARHRGPLVTTFVRPYLYVGREEKRVASWKARDTDMTARHIDEDDSDTDDSDTEVELDATGRSSAMVRIVEALVAHGCAQSADGSQWQCPAHEDRTPSLGVSQAETDGRVLLHCFAGCAVEDVVAALDLTMADLFVRRPAKKRRAAATKAAVAKTSAAAAATKAVVSAPAKKDKLAAGRRPKLGRIVATYDYVDESGTLIYQVCRFDPKDFRVRRPDPASATDWSYSLAGVDRVPYRLPSVQSVAPGGAVWIAEGEADADALAECGVVATTNAGGAGKWLDGWAHYFATKNITIWADDDEPGMRHARQVHDSLAPVAASVRVVRSATGKDARDHLSAGHGLDDVIEIPLDDLPVIEAPKKRTKKAKRPKLVAITGGGGTTTTTATETARDMMDRLSPDSQWGVVDRQGLYQLRLFTGKDPAEDHWVATQLSTFSGEIIEVLRVDNGTETELRYVLRIQAGQHTATVECSPVELTRPTEWAARSGLVGAAIMPGMGQHVLAGMQRTSQAVTSRTVYQHLGWRVIDDRDVYMHAGGALSATGPVDDVETSLVGSLSHYLLPAPATGDRLIEAIHASLAILDAGPDTVTVPLLSAAWRAPIDPPPPWSVFLTGPTGSGKTTLAQIVSAHWGPELVDVAGTSWSSTANAIADITASAGHSLLVIDDWVSRGSALAVDRANAAADQVLRGAANRQGRDRLNRNSQRKLPRPPKATVVVTGESLPVGQSLISRFVACHLGPGDLDMRRDGGPVAAAQQHAAEGLFAEGMAAYICHIAATKAETNKQFFALRDEGRAIADDAPERHNRLPDAIGEMYAAWRTWLEWAESVGAVTAAEATALRARIHRALSAVAAVQADMAIEAQPDRQFLAAIQSAISSGRAHLASRDGTAPSGAESVWGWRQEPNGTWRPVGERIGRVSGSEVWLDPAASFGLAQTMGTATSSRLSGDVRSLGRDLFDAGLLCDHDMQAKPPRHSTRRRLGTGKSAPMARVWVLAVGTLLGGGDDGDADDAPPAPPVPEVPEDTAPPAPPVPPDDDEDDGSTHDF